MLNLTRILGAVTLVGYGLITFAGWDLSSHPRNDVPPSVRSSPGGYRSWSFWHSGEHGGK